jgi:hypothetical protein
MRALSILPHALTLFACFLTPLCCVNALYFPRTQYDDDDSFDYVAETDMQAHPTLDRGLNAVADDTTAAASSTGAAAGAGAGATAGAGAAAPAAAAGSPAAGQQ